MVVPADPLAVLRSFRTAVYDCLGPRRDALFELADALLTAGPVLSPAHLSLETVRTAVLGTPTRPPQPCGRSLGRPPGRRSGPTPRHPALKKTA